MSEAGPWDRVVRMSWDVRTARRIPHPCTARLSTLDATASRVAPLGSHLGPATRSVASGTVGWAPRGSLAETGSP